MWHKWNKKYLEICCYIIGTVGILVLFGAVLFKLSVAKNVILKTARHVLAVFSPFFWSVGITVLLEPLVCFFQKIWETYIATKKRKKIKNRKVGAIITYVLVFGVLFGFGGMVLVQLGTADIAKWAEQIGDFVRKVGDWFVMIQLKLAEYGLLQNVEGLLSTAVLEMSNNIEQFVLRVATALPNAGGQMVQIVIGLTAAFYFLSEKENVQFFLRQVCDVFFGIRKTDCMANICKEIYHVLMGYLGGQFLDATIMGILFSLAFWVIGIPYGVVIGVVSGFSNLIPYFGAVVAFLLAVLSGVFSAVPMRGLYAAIAIILLQQIDSAVIVPKIMGRKMELHPVLVLFSLAVFGGFFGFWGLLLAVPLGALTKNLFFWFYEKKARQK